MPTKTLNRIAEEHFESKGFVVLPTYQHSRPDLVLIPAHLVKDIRLVNVLGPVGETSKSQADTLSELSVKGFAASTMRFAGPPKASRLRLTDEQKIADEKPYFQAGREARIAGMKRKPLPMAFPDKRYSTAWYRHRGAWFTGWDEVNNTM